MIFYLIILIEKELNDKANITHVKWLKAKDPSKRPRTINEKNIANLKLESSFFLFLRNIRNNESKYITPQIPYTNIMARNKLSNDPIFLTKTRYSPYPKPVR